MLLSLLAWKESLGTLRVAGTVVVVIGIAVIFADGSSSRVLPSDRRPVPSVAAGRARHERGHRPRGTASRRTDRSGSSSGPPGWNAAMRPTPFRRRCRARGTPAP